MYLNLSFLFLFSFLSRSSIISASPAFLSFLFRYTDRMTRTLPRMSTTMVKISTLASAVDTPEDALAPQPLSFGDKQFDLFSCWSSRSISLHGAAVILGRASDQVVSKTKGYLHGGGSIQTRFTGGWMWNF